MRLHVGSPGGYYDAHLHTAASPPSLPSHDDAPHSADVPVVDRAVDAEDADAAADAPRRRVALERDKDVRVGQARELAQSRPEDAHEDGDCGSHATVVARCLGYRSRSHRTSSPPPLTYGQAYADEEAVLDVEPHDGARRRKQLQALERRDAPHGDRVLGVEERARRGLLHGRWGGGVGGGGGARAAAPSPLLPPPASRRRRRRARAAG